MIDREKNSRKILTLPNDQMGLEFHSLSIIDQVASSFQEGQSLVRRRPFICDEVIWVGHAQLNPSLVHPQSAALVQQRRCRSSIRINESNC
jgi:hypothetical protein